MTHQNFQSLVDAEWLAAHLEDENLKVIDATYHLPISERDAIEEFEYRRIPGAVHFDVDAVCDRSTDLPHMLPTPEVFAETIGQMGISNDDDVLIYDCSGGFLAAARVWWMFRIFGHDANKLKVLDGGLPQWGKKKKPLENGPADAPAPATYEASFNPALVRTVDQMLANIDSGEEQVLDARNIGRFTGADFEPRPTKHRGHIPGSVNLPFIDLMIPREDFRYRPLEEIGDVFREAGVDLDKPLVAICGSGLTACVISFAAHLLGRDDVPVYDGSWAEWGNAEGLPLEM